MSGADDPFARKRAPAFCLTSAQASRRRSTKLAGRRRQPLFQPPALQAGNRIAPSSGKSSLAGLYRGGDRRGFSLTEASAVHRTCRRRPPVHHRASSPSRTCSKRKRAAPKGGSRCAVEVKRDQNWMRMPAWMTLASRALPPTVQTSSSSLPHLPASRPLIATPW